MKSIKLSCRTRLRRVFAWWSYAFIFFPDHRQAEWAQRQEAAKKAGKVVFNIPPSAQLRRALEDSIKRQFGFEVEVVPSAAAKIIRRIADEALVSRAVVKQSDKLARRLAMWQRVPPILIVALGVSLTGVLYQDTPMANAQAQPFYQGKTIRIVVGFTPGGFYDRWARLLARYMPKYIPGNPEMIVQNMPGASSVIAANYVYNVAKGDGLTLLVPINSLYLDQLVERKEVQFDVRKFEWIGTQEKAPIMLYFRADTPYKSIADIIKASEPPKCGATGTASTGYLLAKLMEENLKAKLQTVSGYQGGSEVDVAVERGEIVCRGMDIPPHFGREPFDTWHKNGFDRHILQGGPKRDPRLADTPTLFELMDQYKTPEVGRQLTRVILASGDLGRPMVAGPGTPADRVKTLRDAYARAMKDPGLIEEAKKGQMDMEHTRGETLQTLLKEIMDQPREVIDRVKKILAE